MLDAMFALADLGPLLAQMPGYNAQTVLEILDFLGCQRVILTQVTNQAWQDGSWRNLENPLLFALADETRFTVSAIGPDWAWAEAQADQLFGFLGQYPKGQATLRQLQQSQQPLRQALAKPIGIDHLYSPELLDLIETDHLERIKLLQEGPGTLHRARRLGILVEELQVSSNKNAVVITTLDDLAALQRQVPLKMPDLAAFRPGEAARFRALVDRAFRLEENDDLDALVHQLLALDGPADSVLGRLALEARFAASGVYLAVGDLESALDLLEAVSAGHFARPAYLAGYVLARLGQVRDLLGQRERAVRAYQAALALSWLPAAAREVAESGQVAAFSWQQSG
jgi:tetratricopeptide (TPR) repeat protein